MPKQIDAPIGRRKRRFSLTTDQSGAGSAGLVSRRTNRTQDVRVYSHDGPIRRRTVGFRRRTGQRRLVRHD
eukprot:182814-Pyramimonas_sp.AAC.1